MYESEPTDPKTRTGLAALGIALSLFAAAGTGLFVAANLGSRDTPAAPVARAVSKASAPVQQAAPAPPPAGEQYPWPECAACVAYLSDRLHDPSSLQIAKWEKRDEISAGNLKIFLRFRAKNNRGTLEVRRGMFSVIDGRVTSFSELN